jgi:hypothetical protein
MRLFVVTDEISRERDRALDVCEDLGTSTVELRVVGEANIISHSDGDLKKIKSTLDARGLRVGGIASPFLRRHIRGDREPRKSTPTRPHLLVERISGTY